MTRVPFPHIPGPLENQALFPGKQEELGFPQIPALVFSSIHTIS